MGSFASGLPFVSFMKLSLCQVRNLKTHVISLKGPLSSSKADRMDMYDQSRFLICFDFPYPLYSPLIFPPFPEKKKATAAMIVHKAKNPFLRDMSELPFRFDDL